jgi:hypothetical protein
VTLTGSAFLITALLITAAAFVGALIGIPMIHGRRWLTLTFRAGALVALNALVLLTAAIVFNDKYQFYADWTDLHNGLFGGPIPSITRNAGGTVADATAPNAFAGATVVPSGQHWKRVGQPGPLTSYQLTGASSGLTGQVLVTLPPGYNAAANKTRRYPVLETFPGYPATPAQWFVDMDLGHQLNAVEQAGRMAPVITISPQTEFPGGVDTECVNGPGGDPQVETWLTRDVPAWVEHTFRAATGRTSWATLGMSAGAWCSAMAPMLNPRQYAAGIVMGGYFEPDFTANYRPFEPDSGLAHRYDLIALAHDHPPPVALWLETSRADSLSYPSSSKLLAAARAPLSIHAVVLLHAGHRYGVWTPLLPKALTWLGANIPGFRPY